MEEGAMVLSRRQFTQEFKVAAVQQLEAGKSVAEVARAFEVVPSLLQGWRRQWRENPQDPFPGQGRRMVQESREAELERKIGQLTMENDFFKKTLAATRAAAKGERQ
jgi:transposase